MPDPGSPVFATPDDVATELNRQVLDTDRQADQLERRITAIEEVIAARWPWRAVLRRRLARQLRRSVRHFPGRTWRDRRIEAVTCVPHS